MGNPPFLGGSKKRGALGDDDFEALERLYAGRVPAGADLLTYWFEKARAHLVAGQCRAAGLVATNSIRGGANRKVLERILCKTQLTTFAEATVTFDTLELLEKLKTAGFPQDQAATLERALLAVGRRLAVAVERAA
ncbi:hypothetical protein G3480_26285 [Thiorhodococcus mannitoliphagus]|uniref:MmeI-like DNA-methyltransferase domain-containing protein n=1 Tax=Thiorhodococcus mannitoliphagus TaxID=329406 RepID=A0A6P1E6W4_9GAMM|nr:DNA methyltransferase [Thiorhodococcus mannitoliphagus]NEX23734.1 hypothetical protein [Thiorhodococcus mannitoliphagus]